MMGTTSSSIGAPAASRAVKSYTIPGSLWRGETLYFPANLAAAYERKVRALGRLGEVSPGSKDRRGTIGGSSDREAEDHFVHRYVTAAARVEYLCLDPRLLLGEIAAELLATFSGGAIAVLDIPCGSGAATMSLLATLAHLRADAQLPTLPLNVRVVGGDVSARCRSLFQEIGGLLAGDLARVGINLTLDLADWDCRQPNTTAALVDAWLKNAGDAEEYVVLVSAFSGVGDTGFDGLRRSFEHVAERLHDKRSTMLWAEPASKSGGRFLQKIGRWFKMYIPWFAAAEEEYPEIGFRWWHPTRDEDVRGSLAVRKFVRS